MSPWSSSTAPTWDLGVIAGTGVVGAVLHGGPERHVVTLAHERFFVPANSRRPAPGLAPVLPAVRAALNRGDDGTAADLIADRLAALGIDPAELVWTDPLAPLCQLTFEPGAGAADGYRRETPVDSLGTSVSWRHEGSLTGLRITAVRGESGIDLELWSQTSVDGTIALGAVGERRAGADTVEVVDYSRAVTTSVSTTERELVADVIADGRASGTGVTARVTVSADRDLVVIDDRWHVNVSADAPLRLHIAVETDAPGPRGVDALPADALWSSALSVGGTLDTTESNEQLWQGARDGYPIAEACVLELAYAAGRRNIIASTGALPPTLQGVWQGTWSPAWSADYTLNGNVQLGSLAAVLWTGTPSLLASMFRLVRQYADHYRSNARAIFGIPGMLLPARLTTHGHANHFLRDYPHQFWTGHGSWLLRMAVDYIQVTGDRAVIDDWLWDYATEILDFGLAVVADGAGHFTPSYSPENTPAGHDNPLVVDATGDIAALRDGLRVGTWLADTRGERATAERWRAARSMLPDYRVSADGTLAEWAEPWPEHLEHRHVSQLHGLWYEVDERFDNPQLRAAALATVRRKVAWRAEAPYGPPGHMEMAFGLSSLGLAAAALGDAANAYQCALWLARDHVTPALVTTHDEGAIFNLDASGALPAIVAAMLLGTSLGRVLLLPALPEQWPTGTVTGLTGRGGVLLHSLHWSADSIECDFELSESAAWMRPAVTRIVLPRDGILASQDGITQLTPRELELREGLGRISFRLAFDRPAEPGGGPRSVLGRRGVQPRNRPSGYDGAAQ